MRAFLLTLGLIFLFSVSGFAQVTISDETPPTTCGNKLITGLKCAGGFCDNLTPVCGKVVRNIYDIRWTQFVSDEGGAVASCNVSNPYERGDYPNGEPAFITGLSCNGRYCDNIALECVALRDAFPESLGGAKCRWTDWISEESPTLNFPKDFGAISMACRGKYCDDVRFFVCPIKAR